MLWSRNHLNTNISNLNSDKLTKSALGGVDILKSGTSSVSGSIGTTLTKISVPEKSLVMISAQLTLNGGLNSSYHFQGWFNGTRAGNVRVNRQLIPCAEGVYPAITIYLIDYFTTASTLKIECEHNWNSALDVEYMIRGCII